MPQSLASLLPSVRLKERVCDSGTASLRAGQSLPFFFLLFLIYISKLLSFLQLQPTIRRFVAQQHLKVAELNRNCMRAASKWD